MTPDFKSGFVAIIGRPNVGKSTLMNHLIGQKIAITSKKPQTTRNRIQTVYTCEKGQIVFLDTPGIHKAKNKLGEYMVASWQSRSALLKYSMRRSAVMRSISQQMLFSSTSVNSFK